MQTIAVKLGPAKKARVVSGRVTASKDPRFVLVSARVEGDVWASWEFAAETVERCATAGIPVIV